MNPRAEAAPRGAARGRRCGARSWGPLSDARYRIPLPGCRDRSRWHGVTSPLPPPLASPHPPRATSDRGLVRPLVPAGEPAPRRSTRCSDARDGAGASAPAQQEGKGVPCSTSSAPRNLCTGREGSIQPCPRVQHRIRSRMRSTAEEPSTF